MLKCGIRLWLWEHDQHQQRHSYPNTKCLSTFGIPVSLLGVLFFSSSNIIWSMAGYAWHSAVILLNAGMLVCPLLQAIYEVECL